MNGTKLVRGLGQWGIMLAPRRIEATGRTVLTERLRSGFSAVLQRVRSFSAGVQRSARGALVWGWRRSCALAEEARDLWRRSRFLRRLCTSVLLGISIKLALAPFHHGGFGRDLENAAMDWMMRVHQGLLPRGDMPFRFVYIDIDERTYRAWGHPLHVPRDKLAQLIRFAVGGSPRLVIVDVDLTEPSGEADSELRSLLAEHRASKQPKPAILLVRAVAQRGRGTEMRPSFLDDVVPLDPYEQGVGKVYWTSSAFERDPDWTIRRWRTWEQGCLADHQRSLLSVTLAAAVLAADGANEVDIARLYEQIPPTHQPCAPATNTEASLAQPEHAQPSITIDAGSLRLKFPPTEINQRIRYVLPWELAPGRRWPLVSSGGRRGALLTPIPARSITEAAGSLSTELLRNAIVAIGGSFAEGRDLHLTPLGEMPGALILLNALHSLVRHGQVETPGTTPQILVLVSCILLCAVFSALFHSFWALLFSSLALIAVLLPLSFYLFNQGIWLDFALPLVAVLPKNLAGQYEDARHASRLHSEV